MVFAANPPNGGITFAQFRDAAIASTGTVYTPGGSSGGTGGSGSTTPGSSGTKTDGTTVPTSKPSDAASRVVGGGVFAAIVGAVAAFAL